MMDVSDGLAWDLFRLARASQRRIDLECIPVHRDARRLARTTPYPGEAVGPAGPAMLSDRFYYAVPGTGSMFDVGFKKVAAIHRVVGDL